MFSDMKQFLSSDICLSCQGCCRFDQEKSDWRPKVGELEERPILAHLPLDKKVESRGLIEKGSYLKDKLCQGTYMCTFLNPDDTKCEIYYYRPFECRLYPFVLTRLHKKPALSVHLPCPVVLQKKNTPAYDEYVDYLKTFFQKTEVLRLIRENPQLFGSYQGYENELEWVFDMSF